MARTVTRDWNWVCPGCKTVQPKAPSCVHCGTVRPKEVRWLEPGKGENLRPDSAMDVAERSVFCDHCETVYDSALGKCPQCGDRVTNEDERPVELEGVPVQLPKELWETEDDQQTASAGLETPAEHDPEPQLHTTREIEPEDEYETPRRELTIINIPWKMVGIGAGVVVGLVLLFLGIRYLMWGSETHPEQIKITGFGYNYWKEVAYIDVEKGSCWKGECPPFDRQTDSKWMDYTPGDNIEVGATAEVCKDCASQRVCATPDPEEKVCGHKFVDGTEQTTYCTAVPPCETIYSDTTKIVPVYATATPYSRLKIFYENDVARTRNESTGWIKSHTITKPDYTLKQDKQERFTGKEGVSLVLYLQGDTRTFEYPMDQSQAHVWQNLEQGEYLTGQVSNFGTLTDLDLP